VLRVINTRLGANFDADEFDHVSHWDAANEWIEMRLRARRELSVEIPGADLTVRFAAGEHIRTEISAKFRPGGIEAELAAAGFALDRWWTDSQQRFGVSLARSVRG
jgi:L-histidine N-alpha-methyltransferase